MQVQHKLSSRFLSNNAESLIDALCTSKAFKVPGTTWVYNTVYGLDDCDVLVIDTDTTNGRAFWQKQKSDNPKPVLVAYTDNYAQSKANDLILQKPLRPSELSKLLENIASSQFSTQHSISQSQTDQAVTTALPTSASPVSVATENTLTEKSVLQALLELRPGPIAVKRNELEIVFDFDARQYHCNQTGLAIDKLLQQSHQDFVITTETASHANRLPGYDLVPVLESVIKAHHSHRLLPWFDSNDRFQLSRWPDFSLLSYQPKHVKIAVAIKQQACAMAEIIQRCNLSFAEVAGFINLCYTLGYVDHLPLAHEMLALPSQPVNDRPPKINLFSKIRKRLGIL